MVMRGSPHFSLTLSANDLPFRVCKTVVGKTAQEVVGKWKSVPLPAVGWVVSSCLTLAQNSFLSIPLYSLAAVDKVENKELIRVYRPLPSSLSLTRSSQRYHCHDFVCSTPQSFLAPVAQQLGQYLLGSWKLQRLASTVLSSFLPSLGWMVISTNLLTPEDRGPRTSMRGCS
ncbi:hypothetical protein LX32DRAFT_298980 [Colletotrichum zoysiae]|uniref:Uncharacterized protein n=1 Tax=Colletotrichum zoysiae TaxID=1216348 RepID=A0AAD9LT09_9PEZI|nr:hypothetical protein LX32DRAFT_298980 [Colletotrichum zoysiae]